MRLAQMVEGRGPVKLHELTRAGRAPALPLSLELTDGVGTDVLHVPRLLRVIPGQRYVGVGEWRGRTVLAKLLVGGKAARHFQRELAGATLLAERQLTTPELLAHGLREGDGGWLLFEYLDAAQGLGDAWQAVANEPPLSDGQREVLAEALTAIASLHAQGLWQADLHLDNLLRHQGKLYLIDGGAIRAEKAGVPLSRRQVMENLGLFFAHLPTSFEPFIEELLVHYLLVNGEHALPLERLLDISRRMRREGMRGFIRSLGRTGKHVQVSRGFGGLTAVVNGEAERLSPILADPEAAMAGGKPLKLGDSTTVVRVETDNGPVVIKRYNLLGWWHWLRRCLMPTRAWRCWISGHRLEYLGIPTPPTLAVIEKRCCGLRGRSYLITEYRALPDLLHHLQPDAHTVPPEPEVNALKQLFSRLLRERISHGDFKGTNLLWDQDHWVMIDLDAMRYHRWGARFRRAYEKDRRRVLENWRADAAAFSVIDARLPHYVDG